MKSSTELIKATDDAVRRLVSRNVEEKGKPDRYAVGAMDGYLQGYCDGANEELIRYEQAREEGELLAYNCEKRARQETIDRACNWLEKELSKLAMKSDIPQFIEDFRKAMTRGECSCENYVKQQTIQ